MMTYPPPPRPHQSPSFSPSPTSQPSSQPALPEKRTMRLALALLIGGGVALISCLCVLVMSSMFFFALWNDGTNDISFVALWGLSSVFIGGLAALVISLVLGGGIGWYVYRR